MILEVIRWGQIRYVTDAEVQQWAPIFTAIALVETGFVAEAKGEVRNFPVVREMIPEHSGIFGVKSGFLPQAGVLGLKSGGYWKQNLERYQVGAHQSTVLLFHPESGQQVLIWSPRPSSVDQFVKSVADLGLKLTAAATPERVVRDSEILVTTTPAFEPVVRTEWLHPWLHINAIGADTRNKQELATELIPTATQVIVDSFEQACELGELQHPYRAGLIGREQVVTLGQVLIGEAQGRRTPADVTIFDSTGLIMQDLVVADYVWRQVASK